MRWLLPLLLLTGCEVYSFGPEEIRDCDERALYWPDEDGDGVGDAGQVYVGCEPPEGWVDVPPPDTGDTGA